MSSEKLENRLELLRQDYLKKLAAHAKELRRLREVLSKGFLPLKDIQQLYRTTHNFSGSGTTFGFPEISATARDLHNALKTFLDAGGDASGLSLETSDLRQKLETFESSCRDAMQKKDAPAAAIVSGSALPGSLAESDKKTIGLYPAHSTEAKEIAGQLQHFGYNVLLSDDEAAFTNDTCHVLLAYADMNGDALAFIDRASKSGLPVIAVSTDNEFEARLSAVRAGVRAYFAGNADVLKVMDKIEQLTARQTNAAWNVLIVDDDEILAEFYAQTLRGSGMKASILTNPSDTLHALAEQSFNLVLIDFNMPHCDGQELATIIRQHEQYVTLPMVFMSAQDNIESLLINKGLGIDDFLVKPFTPQQLVSVVSSRAQRATELKGFMVRDHFTGLLNHANFLEVLSGEVMNVRRRGHDTCYAMIDIDHFKRINDTYGHAAGDRVIKSLSRMLQQQLRRSDILGRCGGEEFGILMPNCTIENATRIMENLREKFSGSPLDIGTDKITVTFSGGVTRIGKDIDLDKLVSKVDEALYEAKKGGRNRVTTVD